MFEEIYATGWTMGYIEIVASGGTYKDWWAISLAYWKTPDGPIIKER